MISQPSFKSFLVYQHGANTLNKVRQAINQKKADGVEVDVQPGGSLSHDSVSKTGDGEAQAATLYDVLNLSARRRDGKDGPLKPFHIIAELKGEASKELENYARIVSRLGLNDYVTFTSFRPIPKSSVNTRIGLNVVDAHATHQLPALTQQKTDLLLSTLPIRAGKDLLDVDTIHPSMNDMKVRGIDIANRENGRRTNKANRLGVPQASMQVIPYVYDAPLVSELAIPLAEARSAEVKVKAFDIQSRAAAAGAKRAVNAEKRVRQRPKVKAAKTQNQMLPILAEKTVTRKTKTQEAQDSSSILEAEKLKLHQKKLVIKTIQAAATRREIEGAIEANRAHRAGAPYAGVIVNSTKAVQKAIRRSSASAKN